MELIRSLLFVPGIQPKMIAKAPSVPADVVCLDLEDSVPIAEKPRARELVREAIPEMPRTGYRLFVRINSLATGFAEEDLFAVVSEHLDGISLPKTDSTETVRRVDAYLTLLEKTRGLPVGQVKIIPWVETAIGLVNCYEIATASLRLIGISFGGEDYTTDMGIPRTPQSKELEYGRNVVAHACRAAGIEAIDTPEPDFRDLAHLEEDSLRARNMGYRGKYCIHPAQVEVVNRVFQPSEAEIEHARLVVTTYEAAEFQGLGAVALEGVMIDAPIVKRARALLEWAERAKARRS